MLEANGLADMTETGSDLILAIFQPTIRPIDFDLIKHRLVEQLPDGALRKKELKLERLRLLAELLQEHNDGPFFMSVRLAGEMIGVGKDRAAYFIDRLVKAGELLRVKGNAGRHQKRLADEYVYLNGAMNEHAAVVAIARLLEALEPEAQWRVMNSVLGSLPGPDYRLYDEETGT